jgi:hypothetical protein
MSKQVPNLLEELKQAYSAYHEEQRQEDFNRYAALVKLLRSEARIGKSFVVIDQPSPTIKSLLKGDNLIVACDDDRHMQKVTWTVSGWAKTPEETDE